MGTQFLDIVLGRCKFRKKIEALHLKMFGFKKKCLAMMKLFLGFSLIIVVTAHRCGESGESKLCHEVLDNQDKLDKWLEDDLILQGGKLLYADCRWIGEAPACQGDCEYSESRSRKKRKKMERSGKTRLWKWKLLFYGLEEILLQGELVSRRSPAKSWKTLQCSMSLQGRILPAILWRQRIVLPKRCGGK